MKLFIDTNIYLKFYHFTSDELEELNKLIVLIDEDEIELLIPEQVINEFRRNREVKIADALKKLRGDNLEGTFPVFCKEYEEFKKMNKAISEYQENKKALIDKLKTAIESYKLKADEVIEKLFAKAILIEITEGLIQRAKRRFDLGNPPGKNNSYGDAVNWESLMLEVNYGEDLFFLSDDTDYFSKINNKNFNKYLSREWEEIKNSKIVFYKSISDFFKENFPDIKLATEYLKDLTISKLEESGNFKTARKHLYKLSDLHDFNSNQINKIFNAVLNNNQILWISEDHDINEILFKWVDDYSSFLGEEAINSFKSKVEKILDIDEDELPF